MACLFHSRLTLDSEIIDTHRLRIRISDNGEGLSEEKTTRLFTPFESLNTTFSVEDEGIGLAISKKIVELMDGNIGIDSVPGIGSPFWVELSSVTSDTTQ